MEQLKEDSFFYMEAKTKKVFFCIDFEDWYHIPYLAKYGFEKKDFESYTDKISDFVGWLDENGIPANFFVVGEIAEEHQFFLRKCHEHGHQICCHSYSHLPVNKMTNEEFVEDTKKAKKAIEDAIGCSIFGYRAPFFSMTDEKLPLLKNLGFSFDSSFIKSSANEYYSKLSMNGYTKIDSLIYEKNGFKEFEIPTLKGKPIAGGGFFRLYPFFLFKKYIYKFLKTESNFIFFIHPFEIAGNVDFKGLSKMNFKDRIRFQLGRKGALKKLKKTLMHFKNKNYCFSILE